MSLDFRKIWPHLASLLIFVLLACGYFAPQLSGKKIQQSDIMQYKGGSSEIKQYRDKSETILWTNAMFGGMPTYQIGLKATNNVAQYGEMVSRLFFKAPIGTFLSAMVVFYIAMLLLNVNSWLALIGAIGFAFTTNHVVLYEAGHNTKLRALAFGVLILAGAIKVFRKDYIIGGVAFAIGLALNLFANHYQMTYYIGLVGIILVIYYLIESIRQQELSHFLKSIAVLSLGAIIALGTSVPKLLTTYEYSKSTMRGEPILEKVEGTTAKSSSETEGLEWNYSMGWSNGMIDIMASLIPGVAGGGSSEPIAKNSATNKFLRKNGAQRLEYGPMYWGKLPFTSGPIYMGAICIFLFILSLFVLKSHLKWWGLASIILTFALSMGANFEFLSRIFYDYFPMYNKFRSPSSITGVTAIVVAMMGVLGLNQLYKDQQSEVDLSVYIRPLLIVTGLLSVICLFYAFVGPSFFSFEGASDARYAQSGFDVSVFKADRAGIMRRDALRSLGLILACGAVLFFFLKNKLKSAVAFVIIAILVAIDLIGVDTRYVNQKSFVSDRKLSSYFNERPVDKQILQDKDPYYRVYDLSRGNPFENSWTSYHHKSLGGYHAAKLQRIQDVNDHYLSKGDQKFLNMTNVKYIINGEPGKEQVFKNSDALGNAWFVDEFQFVDSQRRELEGVANIDPKFTALVNQSFKSTLPDKNTNLGKGSIKLTSYHPDELTYTSNNSQDGFAVFSEVWYGPDKGWKLYIDGQETPIVRADYLLRGAMIPAGQHEIVMKFHPKSFYVGNSVALVSSILLLLGLGFAFYKKITSTPSSAK